MLRFPFGRLAIAPLVLVGVGCGGPLPDANMLLAPLADSIVTCPAEGPCEVSLTGYSVLLPEEDWEIYTSVDGLLIPLGPYDTGLGFDDYTCSVEATITLPEEAWSPVLDDREGCERGCEVAEVISSVAPAVVADFSCQREAIEEIGEMRSIAIWKRVATMCAGPPPYAFRVYRTVTRCGDGIVQAEAGEQCDNGADVPEDDCDRSCQLLPICGDGIVAGDEECDDGNLVVGDGCDSSCRREPGCGDGVVDPAEECDDGNNANCDGCNSTCHLDGVCGDGVVNFACEACDGPGCSADCQSTGCPPDEPCCLVIPGEEAPCQTAVAHCQSGFAAPGVLTCPGNVLTCDTGAPGFCSTRGADNAIDRCFSADPAGCRACLDAGDGRVCDDVCQQHPNRSLWSQGCQRDSECLPGAQCEIADGAEGGRCVFEGPGYVGECHDIRESQRCWRAWGPTPPGGCYPDD